MTARSVPCASLTLGVLMSITASLAAQQSVPQAADLSGKWAMTLHSEHETQTLPLTMKQAGKKLTAVWNTPHGDDLPLDGEFENKTLTLASPAAHEMQLSLTGALKDDGTLAGTMSSQRGDMRWTAARVK